MLVPKSIVKNNNFFFVFKINPKETHEWSFYLIFDTVKFVNDYLMQ